MLGASWLVSMEHPEAPRNTQGHPEGPRNTQEQPGTLTDYLRGSLTGSVRLKDGVSGFARTPEKGGAFPVIQFSERGNGVICTCVSVNEESQLKKEITKIK